MKCKDCGQTFFGDKCNCAGSKGQKPKVDISMLTETEKLALRDSTSWYRDNIGGYPEGRYNKCYYPDIEKALNKTKEQIKHETGLYRKEYHSLNFFTRVLMYGWLSKVLPGEFEAELKRLHIISNATVKEQLNESSPREVITKVTFDVNQNMKVEGL